MNTKAILKGYFLGFLLFFGGGATLVGFALLWGESVIDISPAISVLLWFSLFAGSFSAGKNARKSGYLHGVCVGILWWLSKNIILWLGLPQGVVPYDLMGSIVLSMFLGALGGFCGVNYFLLKRAEKRNFLVKMFKD